METIIINNPPDTLIKYLQDESIFFLFAERKRKTPIKCTLQNLPSNIQLWELLEEKLEPGDEYLTSTEVRDYLGYNISPESIGKNLTMLGYASKMARRGSNPQKVYLCSRKSK